MDKNNAIWILEFIKEHFDYVDQESWYDLQEKLLTVILEEGNARGWHWLDEYPEFFSTGK